MNALFTSKISLPIPSQKLTRFQNGKLRKLQKNRPTNCLIENVTQAQVVEGSLTHNRCYRILISQKEAGYESTVKKRIPGDDLSPIQTSPPQGEDDDP
jgi:hypothetical protein